MLLLKQAPITEDTINNLISIRMGLFYDAADDLAEQLFTGKISIGTWQEMMKGLIRGIHTSVAAIGKGGWSEMTSADWGRLGTPLREQYAYLARFADHIAANRETISLSQIASRSKLYGKASGHSASLMQLPAATISQLPWIPKDGSTECLVGCKCYWSLEVIDVIDVVDGVQIIRAQWHLSDAEHCQDCIDRDGFVTTITAPVGVVVPPRIGGFE